MNDNNANNSNPNYCREKLIEDCNLGLRRKREAQKLWVKVLKSKLGVNKINALYSSVMTKGYYGSDFSKGMLRELSVDIIEEKSENIESSLSRTEQGVVIVCNTPHGGIDGLIMLALCLKYKPATKIVIPRILWEIEPLREVAIVFDSDKKGIKSSYDSMQKHLNEGGNLIIFASDGISAEMKDGTNLRWKDGMLRLISKLKAPIQPLFIKGGNGLTFQSLRKLNTRIELFLSIKEVVNKQGTTFKVLEGARIEKELLATIKETKDLGKLLNLIFALSLEREKEGVGNAEEINRKEINPSMPPKIEDEERLSRIIKGKKPYLEHNNLCAYQCIGSNDDASEEFVVVENCDNKTQKESRVVGHSKINFGDKTLINKDYEFAFFGDYEYSHKMETLLRESIEVEFYRAVNNSSSVASLLSDCHTKRLLESENHRYIISSIEITDSKSKLTRRLITHRIKRFVFTNKYRKLVAPRQSLREGSLPFLSSQNEMLMERRDILLLFARYTDPDGGQLSTEMKKYLQNKGEFIALGKIDRGTSKVIKGLILVDKEKITD